MRAIRMLNTQSLRMIKQLENFHSSLGNSIYARVAKIMIAKRSDDQHATRRYGAYHFMKIKRDVRQTAPIFGKSQHVTSLTPTLFWKPVLLVSIVVV